MEVVWSKSLGLATYIELDSKANRRRAEEEKRSKTDEHARRRNEQERARRREAQVKRQEAALERAEAAHQADRPRKVLRPIQSLEIFRDRLRSGGKGPAMVVLPTGRFRMGLWMVLGFPLRHSARQSRNPATPGLSCFAVIFWMLRLRAG